MCCIREGMTLPATRLERAPASMAARGHNAILGHATFLSSKRSGSAARLAASAARLRGPVRLHRSAPALTTAADTADAGVRHCRGAGGRQKRRLLPTATADARTADTMPTAVAPDRCSTTPWQAAHTKRNSRLHLARRHMHCACAEPSAAVPCCSGSHHARSRNISPAHPPGAPDLHKAVHCEEHAEGSVEPQYGCPAQAARRHALSHQRLPPRRRVEQLVGARGQLKGSRGAAGKRVTPCGARGTVEGREARAQAPTAPDTHQAYAGCGRGHLHSTGRGSGAHAVRMREPRLDRAALHDAVRPCYSPGRATYPAPATPTATRTAHLRARARRAARVHLVLRIHIATPDGTAAFNMSPRVRMRM